MVSRRGRLAIIATVPLMIATLVLLAALAQGSAAPDDPCAALNARIDRTYGFRPSALDGAALQKKTEEMDAVWGAVHHDRALVPCLKAALQRRTPDTWFQMDGSQLLVEVDPSHASKALLLEALRRVPLEDVDLRTWVSLGSSLGADGFDTSELGKRWLSYPKAEYFLPEHGAYRVDRENGAMFLFGALDERFATPALVALSRGSSGEAKDIAVELLMSQATAQALEALAKVDAAGLSPKIAASRSALLHGPELIEPRPHPQTSREQFLRAFSAFLGGDEQPFAQLVEAAPDGERDLVAVAKPEDVDVIRKVRRRFIVKNTQHAIEYYNQFTQILMTLVWKKPERK
jgi:hypothetical protein